MTDPTGDLRKASTAYKRARDRTEQIMKVPRETLAEQVRAAYKSGMKKADILRAIDHVWSRQWVDETVRDIEPPTTAPRRVTKKTANGQKRTDHQDPPGS